MRNTEGARIWSHYEADPNSGCWLWTASVRGKGYGEAWYLGRKYGAHRLSYLLTHGDPGGAVVCHRCDTPLCINPAHLFLGTVLDNNRDTCRKGRQSNAYRRMDMEIARAIRADTGGIRQLAKRYHFDKRHISRIRRGLAWVEDQANAL